MRIKLSEVGWPSEYEPRYIDEMGGVFGLKRTVIDSTAQIYRYVGIRKTLQGGPETIFDKQTNVDPLMAFSSTGWCVYTDSNGDQSPDEQRYLRRWKSGTGPAQQLEVPEIFIEMDMGAEVLYVRGYVSKEGEAAAYIQARGYKIVPDGDGGTGEDGDPNNEALLSGATGVENKLGMSYNMHLSVIYIEAIRESLDAQRNDADFQDAITKRTGLVTAHEMGHAPNGASQDEHTEGGLMGDNAEGSEDFSPQTLARFRNAAEWSK